MKQIKNIFLILGCLFFISCAPIESHSQVKQALDKQLIAGKGDTILTVNHEKNLPNAFGASDIFGRKTSTGETILTFAGAKGQTVYFYKSGIHINSNETTMSQTGMFIPVQNTGTMTGMVGTTPVLATTSQQSTAYIPPVKSRTIVTPMGTTNIAVNLHKEKFIAVEGYIIEIVSASENNLVYKVQKQ